jgi:catechol 2,3-dioxygenase-like lactoylglutathione lyase family enzyme
MDESIKFYTQALGLRFLSRDVNVQEQEDCAFLELDGGNLELLQSLKSGSFEKPQIRPPYCPHLAFTTTDMDATLKMIADKHIPIVKGPLEANGDKWIYIHDPDNNVIEYIQWHHSVD